MPGRAYADVIGNFNRGHAGRVARNGNYADAAGIVIADDPAAAASYAAMDERQRVRGREDETRAYARDYAGAVQRRDFAGAGQRAAQFGDVEGVTSARTMQQQLTEQQRMEAWRRAQGYLGELEAIESEQDPARRQQAWANWIARARQEAQGEGAQFLAQFPDQYSPNAIGALRTQVTRMTEQLLTPQQLAEARRRGQQFRPASPDELRGFRQGTAVDIDTNTGARIVRQNPPAPGAARQGAPAPPPGFVLD